MFRVNRFKPSSLSRHAGSCPSSAFFSRSAGCDFFRWTARALLTAWFAPLFLSLLTALTLANPAPAQAQGGTIEPTVVLDFDVAGGLDPVLGRKAADALAVELQRSGNYDVKTRQEVDNVVQTQPGLRPPYNSATQRNLARALGARSVFSGVVRRVQVDNGRSARVQIEVRQLDAATEDYVNGTLISEVTEQKLQTFDNEVLVDEALNKAAVSAVRSLAQTILPTGNVLNVATDEIQINIGARNGAIQGQRYSVLRDILNRATNRVDRVKTGEIRITRVEAEQSGAVLSAGGAAGVTTGDHVRRIFEIAPVTFASLNSGESSTPVTATPAQRGGTPKIVRKTGAAIIGGIGLLLGVALLGLRSGGSENKAATGVTARPVYSGANGGSTGAVLVSYRRGVPGIVTEPRNIVGYFIYRGEAAGFNISADSLQQFVPRDQQSTTDNVSEGLGRQVSITTTGTGNNTNQGFTTNETTSRTTFFDPNIIEGDFNLNSIKGFGLSAVFNPKPTVSGAQYFYAVERITVINVPSTNGTTTNNNLRIVRSAVSRFSGGATPIVPPTVTAATSNLNAFTVTVNGQGTIPNSNNIFATPTPISTPATIGQTLYPQNTVDTFNLQVSADRTFPSDNRTFSTLVSNPGSPADANGNQFLTFSLGAITVNDVNGNLIQNGSTVFVRVGARNSSDSPGAPNNPPLSQNRFIYGPPFTLVTGTTGAASTMVASRFLPSNVLGRQGAGFRLPNGIGGIGARSGSRASRRPGHVLTPR